jgi:hypothetical protein
LKVKKSQLNSQVKRHNRANVRRVLASRRSLKSANTKAILRRLLSVRKENDRNKSAPKVHFRAVFACRFADCLSIVARISPAASPSDYLVFAFSSHLPLFAPRFRYPSVSLPLPVAAKAPKPNRISPICEWQSVAPLRLPISRKLQRH